MRVWPASRLPPKAVYNSYAFSLSFSEFLAIMSSVAVIDYGMGNLHSIAKALQHADADVTVQISADPQVILAADRVVFPGVGAIRDCMQSLNNTGLAEIIKQVSVIKPLLGICLGMQALMSDSEEGGKTECLNLFSGHVRRFADNAG